MKIKNKYNIQLWSLLFIHIGMFIFGFILILNETNIKKYLFMSNENNIIYIYILFITIINGIIFLLHTPLISCLMCYCCCCTSCIISFTLPIIFLGEITSSIYFIAKRNTIINNDKNNALLFVYILIELFKSILSLILWNINCFRSNESKYEMLDIVD